MWNGWMHDGGMGWWGPGGGWGFGWHAIPMLVFWGVIIALVVVAVRALWRVGNTGRSDSPRTILEERFARGEIDSEEFHRRRRELN